MLVHTYDRCHRHREHPRPDHPRGGGFPPRERLFGHQRAVHRVEGGSGHRQPQYWFPTKSELLVEAWRYLTAKSVEELRRTMNQLTDPLEVLEVGVESLWDSLRRLGDVQLAALDLLVQPPRTDRLRAYLPELFTRYREVIQEQLDRLEEDGRIRLTVPRDVLVPLVLNTVLGFGLYYVVTRDDESCLKALSAFRQLAATLVEPV